MPAFHITTIMFVGSSFHAGMFDERALCPFLGEIEVMDTERKEESGQYKYSRGNYQFSVSPERLTLTGPKIFPKEVAEATRAIIARLAQYSPLPIVTAVGLNCDSIFEQEELGLSGIDFCAMLNNKADIENLLGGVIPLGESMTSTNFYFAEDSVQYSFRIEPHFGTQGKNLFFSMGAHQDMSRKQEIIECMDAYDRIRTYTEKLHECLIRREGSS